MNFWTLLSLIPGLAHLLLGGFVLYREPKRGLNQSFALYAFSLAIWCISEFFHRSASDISVAFIWTRIGGFGWCFMSSLWLYFLLVFSRRSSLLKRMYTYIFLYLPSLVFLYLFWTTDLIYKREPTMAFFGYTVLPGKLVWTYSFYYILIYFMGLYILIDILRTGTVLERKQAKPMLIGSTFFLLLSTVTNVIFPSMEVPATEFATTFSIAWAISFYYVVLKHKLFIMPSTQELIDTPPKYVLKTGVGYLVKEEKPDKGYEIFHDQITHSHSGLCVSKLRPERIDEFYGISGSSIFWLTFNNDVNQKSKISPKDSDILVSVISDFYRKTENPFLFFDCFEQINFACGFERSLSMLKDFIKLCHENDGVMLVSIPPDMFEKQHLNIMEEKLEELKLV